MNQKSYSLIMTTKANKHTTTLLTLQLPETKKASHTQTTDQSKIGNGDTFNKSMSE